MRDTSSSKNEVETSLKQVSRCRQFLKNHIKNINDEFAPLILIKVFEESRIKHLVLARSSEVTTANLMQTYDEFTAAMGYPPSEKTNNFFTKLVQSPPNSRTSFKNYVLQVADGLASVADIEITPSASFLMEMVKFVKQADRNKLPDLFAEPSRCDLSLNDLSRRLFEDLSLIPPSIFCVEERTAHLNIADLPDLFGKSDKPSSDSSTSRAIPPVVAPRLERLPGPVLPMQGFRPPRHAPVASPPPPPPPNRTQLPTAGQAAPVGGKPAVQHARPKIAKRLNNLSLQDEVDKPMTLGHLEISGEPFYARVDTGADAHVAGKELVPALAPGSTRVSNLSAIVPLNGRTQRFREADVDVLTPVGPATLHNAAISPRT